MCQLGLLSNSKSLSFFNLTLLRLTYNSTNIQTFVRSFSAQAGQLEIDKDTESDPANNQSSNQLVDSLQPVHPREISPTNTNIYTPYISKLRSAEHLWDYLMEWGPRIHYKTMTTVIKRLIQLSNNNENINTNSKSDSYLCTTEQKKRILDGITGMAFSETPAFDGTFLAVLLFGYEKCNQQVPEFAKKRIIEIFKKQYTNLTVKPFVNILKSMLILDFIKPVDEKEDDEENKVFIDQMLYFANDELVQNMTPSLLCSYARSVQILNLNQPELVDYIENQYLQIKDDFTPELDASLLDWLSMLRKQTSRNDETAPSDAINNLIDICEKNINNLNIKYLIRVICALCKLRSVDTNTISEFIQPLFSQNLKQIDENQVANVLLGLSKREIYDENLMELFSNRLIQMNGKFKFPGDLATYLAVCIKHNYQNDQLFKQISIFLKTKINDLGDNKMLDAAYALQKVDPQFMSQVVKLLGKKQQQFQVQSNKLPQLLQILSQEQSPNQQLVVKFVSQFKEELVQSNYGPGELCEVLKALALLSQIHKDQEIIVQVMQEISTGYDTLSPQQLFVIAQTCDNMELQVTNQVAFQLAILQSEFKGMRADNLAIFLQHLLALDILSEGIWEKGINAIKGEGGASADILQEVTVKAKSKGLQYVQI